MAVIAVVMNNNHLIILNVHILHTGNIFLNI